MRRIIASVVCVASCFALFGNASGSVRKLIRIEIANKDVQTVGKLMELAPDVAGHSQDGRFVEIIARQDKIDKIRTLGFKVETIIPDLEKLNEEWHTQDYFDHFHNYQQTLDEMQEAANNYPNLARLVDIGDGWEKTQGLADRDIWVIKISDNVNDEEPEEAEVLIMGCHHAREIITPEIVLYYMNYLLDNYGNDPYATYLVDNRQIWLVPLVNPDGHAYVFDVDRWWRKNRRDNGDGTFGVDINRNYGYMWGYDNQGSSPYTSSETYRGTGPFSEPETQTIRDFTIQHQFKIALSYHSYSRLWLFPWGYKHAQTPDHEIFMALADSCVAYNHYSPEPGYELYITNGDTDDWMYGEQTTKNKVFGFTPEVGTRFHPDTTVIMQEILENLGPNLYVTYAVGEEPIVVHQPLCDTENETGPYEVVATIKSAIPLTAPSTLDPANFWVHYNTTGVAPFDSVVMTAGAGSDEYVGQIPGQGTNVTIYYYISAASTNGGIGHSPRPAPYSLHSYIVGADTEAPQIAHIPLGDKSVYTSSYPVIAEVTDNQAVDAVWVHFRKNGNDLDSLQMLPTGTADEYRADIVPASPAAGDLYEYRIEAVDASVGANRSLLPETGFYSFRVISSLLYDFEAEESFSSAQPSDWEWGVPVAGPDAAHSGINVWGTNLDGNYSDASNSLLDVPQIELENTLSSVHFRFWHWYDHEYSDNTFWDGGNVKIAEDGGPYQVIPPEGGYDGMIDSYNTIIGGEQAFGGPQGTGNFWQQETIDLTRYIGHVVQLRFHFGSDAYTTQLGWYIDDVKFDFSTAVEDQGSDQGGLPTKYRLLQNYPNPFNPVTAVEFQLPKQTKVLLEVYNLLGQRVRLLIDSEMPAGRHHASWDGLTDQGRVAPSGVYLCRIQAGEFVATRKMIKLQ